MRWICRHHARIAAFVSMSDAGQIRSDFRFSLAALAHGWSTFVGVVARGVERIWRPSSRLKALGLDGRGDDGAVWAWTARRACAQGWRRGDGRAPQGGAQPGAGRGAALLVIFRKSRTRRGFLARVRMVSATASPRALMRPMAKRRSRVMFCGPWPVRMRLRSSSKLQSRMWCIASNPPVSAIEGEEALGGCALGGEAGDAVDGFDAPLGGLDLDGFAPDGEDLSDTGEVEVGVEFGGAPDGAPFATAVLGLRPLVDELRRALGDGLIEQEADIVEHVRLVAIDGEQVVGAAPEQIRRQRPLGEQRIGGDGQAGVVGQRLEQGEDGANPIGALVSFVGAGPHADFSCPQGALESWPTMPIPDNAPT